MKKLRLILGALALTFGLGIAQHQSVQAAGAEFSVTPVLGNDQINGVTDYFNLLVSPSQTRDLQVQVENTSKEAKTFVVTLTNAYSQSNGEIGYEPKDQDDVDSSLTAPLTSFSSKPKQEVKVAAGQTQTVTIPLKVPAAGFTGVKLGGIHVLDQSVSAPAEAGEGISLNNQFAMIIGVQLQTNADAVVTTQPDLKLGKVAAGTENNNASGGVIVTLRNVAPIYIDDLKATVEVTKKGESKPLLTRTVTQWSMAPNSSLPLTLSTEKELEPGDYDVKVNVATSDKDWAFKDQFTIKAQEAKKVNQALGLTPKSNGPTSGSGSWVWYLVGGMAVVIVGLAGGMVWWWRRSRKQQAA